MLRKPTNEIKEKRVRNNRVRFPGICADAKALGVSRIHLYFVLSKQRISKPLTRRYRALKQEQALEAETKQ